MSEESAKELSLEDLPELRRKTESVSRFLRDQIAAHLETLRPLFAPEDEVAETQPQQAARDNRTEITRGLSGGERALAELQQNYKAFTRKPYDLPETLDPNWLALVGNALELHPWEYLHQTQGKSITMSSPVRWAVNYRANYRLAQVKSALDGKETVRPDYLRQFVVNALVLQLVLSRNLGLTQLFEDLRYELKTNTPSDLKGLPVVTITSCLTSFRPADDLILAATAFSGVPAFIELIILDAAQTPRDTLKERLEEMMK